MKKYLLLGLTLVLMISNSCKNSNSSEGDFDSNFAHVVYFWLKNPDNSEDRKAFETSLKKFLNTSDYAKTKFIGVPANTPRDVVDNSWTYSIILTFPSKEAQNSYQEEPVHLKFIEESAILWDKVQVYDSVGL
ncbi:Dabb family protein [Leeuwenhoekiella aequorea]|uniref:Stress responsive alpha/beta barrel protein n=1 Tax=Leeuwenhoekiella aequorea TaxID=283736 RepID=A0A4Q0PDA1_9FLAO|nr:Dabb family protein [Leeuwenhoekiella aequorea]RXG24671.1 stress responsive alpha/beta barrel protein [Leeuwenhoekiella aequorea]